MTRPSSSQPRDFREADEVHFSHLIMSQRLRDGELIANDRLLKRVQ